MANHADRDLDIVVYGASGFVGRLVAQYLATSAPDEVRVGIAGRSAEKLAAVRATLGPRAAEWPIIVADAADASALAALAEQTSVIATTVGPYAKFGVPLVAACAAAGTHYADLTGEVLFVRRCIDEFDELARSTGARIVNSCGFDSIPSDLGVLVTYLAAHEAGAGSLGDTRFVMRAAKGGFSGGTIDSLRNQIDVAARDPHARRIVADPFALSPDRDAEPPVSRTSVDRDTRGVGYDAKLGGWTGPFVMASYNTRIVRRSNALAGWEYGEGFHYQEVTGFGASPLSPVLAGGMAVGLAGLMAGMGFAPSRALLDRVLPEPGQGPSEAARTNGYFKAEVHAVTSSGRRVRTTVAAHGDPGYAATSVMLGESALSLALDELPDRAGVLTPAVAMGSALVSRLRAAGFTLEPDLRG